MGLMDDFYILCDCLGDDLKAVARIIQKHYHVHHKLSRIESDIENGEGRMQKYQETINKILDMPYSYVLLFKMHAGEK